MALTLKVNTRIRGNQQRLHFVCIIYSFADLSLPLQFLLAVRTLLYSLTYQHAHHQVRYEITEK
jgi:hypothetical protein